MWIKDNYQENMLGYLGGMRAEIEWLTRANLSQHDLNKLRAEFDSASELLWGIIECSDTNWVGFRYSFEERCDDLLRTLHRLPASRALEKLHRSRNISRPRFLSGRVQ